MILMRTDAKYLSVPFVHNAKFFIVNVLRRTEIHVTTKDLDVRNKRKKIHEIEILFFEFVLSRVTIQILMLTLRFLTMIARKYFTASNEIKSTLGMHRNNKPE